MSNLIELKEIAGGALQEKASQALDEVFANMQDPNTPWKNKREIVIKLKLTQNEDRDDAACEISVEKKLAQPKPIQTRFYMGTDLKTGEVYAEEYGSGCKGQLTIDDIQTEVDGKTVDTETGEIMDQPQDGTVVDFRAAKQA